MNRLSYKDLYEIMTTIPPIITITELTETGIEDAVSWTYLLMAPRASVNAFGPPCISSTLTLLEIKKSLSFLETGGSICAVQYPWIPLLIFLQTPTSISFPIQWEAQALASNMGKGRETTKSRRVQKPHKNVYEEYLDYKDLFQCHIHIMCEEFHLVFIRYWKRISGEQQRVPHVFS